MQERVDELVELVEACPAAVGVEVDSTLRVAVHHAMALRIEVGGRSFVSRRHHASSAEAMAGLNVVICGAGIAGIEGLVRLRRLVGKRVQLTLVSPEDEFLYRPLAVREPFALSGVPRYPLERIASDTGARWIRDRLARVDVDACAVHTEGGRLAGWPDLGANWPDPAPTTRLVIDPLDASLQAQRPVVVNISASGKLPFSRHNYP